MASKPLTFRQRDVRAAIKAAKDAGAPPSRVEIDRRGKIVLIFGAEAADVSAGERAWAERVR